jgi:crotonobetainyl-CoA:carnitine CoA-transferase CaiB-like acyl-CoA transferase
MILDRIPAGQPPLDGVRVVEYSRALPARAAGALLADLGAQVVQVPADGGAISADDPARVWSDRRKWLRAVGAAPADQATEVRRLLPAADVLIVDLPPGRLEDAGLDAVTVRAGAPAVVHVWMPPYGIAGRASYLDADPLLLSAVSGYADNYPAVADRPVAPVVPTFMYLHGAMGATAATAGLIGRERAGTGNSVRVTGLDAMGAVLGPLMIKRDSDDAFPSVGRGAAGAPYFRLYQGADEQWFYLAALSPSIFTRALDAIGRIDIMVRDDVLGEFANFLVPAVRAEVGADLEATFATRPAGEWLDVFRSADVPAAPVWSRQQWLAAGIGLAGSTSAHDAPSLGLGPVTVPAPPLDFPLTPMLAGTSQDRELPAWARGGHPVSAAQAGPLTNAPTNAPTNALTKAATKASPLPLNGVRVVDLSSYFAGPFAGALLADFGAEVIKVEPADGDPYRMYAASFTMVNQGKQMVALDLADPAARSAFLQLLAGADALLDNSQPQSLERLALSASVVAAASPDLVRCSLSAFGQGNEWSTAPGFDPVLQSMTGLAIAQGGPGSPSPSSAPTVDTATGALAALGLLAALLARARLGAGQHVRTSLASGAVFIQSAELTSYQGRPPAAAGTVDYLGQGPWRRLYAASDGWIAIAAATQAQRAGLLAAIGHREWSALDDAKLAIALEKELALDACRLWLDRLHVAGVPSVQVLAHQTGIADQFLSVNGFSHLVEVPEMGTFRIVRSLSTWEGGSPRRGLLPSLGRETVRLLRAAGVDQPLVDDLLARQAAISPGR